MGVKGIVAKLLGQHFLEDMKTDLEQMPDRIKRWYTNNFIQRSLSYLVAFTENKKAIVLKCTADGKLKVAPSGSGLTLYEVVSGTCVDAYAGGQTHAFADNNSYIDILVETFGVTMSVMQENGAWGDDIALPVGEHDYSFVTKGVKFKNRTAGSNGVYEVVAMR